MLLPHFTKPLQSHFLSWVEAVSSLRKLSASWCCTVNCVIVILNISDLGKNAYMPEQWKTVDYDENNTIAGNPHNKHSADFISESALTCALKCVSEGHIGLCSFTTSHNTRWPDSECAFVTSVFYQYEQDFSLKRQKKMEQMFQNLNILLNMTRPLTDVHDTCINNRRHLEEKPGGSSLL